MFALIILGLLVFGLCGGWMLVDWLTAPVDAFRGY
jgi:hypothetical protein